MAISAIPNKTCTVLPHTHAPPSYVSLGETLGFLEPKRRVVVLSAEISLVSERDTEKNSEREKVRERDMRAYLYG
jgi:hypothetical protein